MDYPNAKFLIYNSWEKDVPFKVAGSLLVDCAFTQAEADEKVHLYKKRHAEFKAEMPILYTHTRTSIYYIINQPEWWRNY